ncbi:septal ring lytic transglycosylase RlpA family protein [Aromatoleum anaerobium]|nr:septal ring lytic transglycosylase RlpA family protein [Aromatoleum anaerobium]MCK0507591.1 septal ring lytic transglycosylase RlpA family protein [Aromatoleum anaerobium]
MRSNDCDPMTAAGVRSLALGLALAGAFALGLSGCGSTPSRDTTVQAPASAGAAARRGAYYKDDGPGSDIPANLDAIADAEPRLEPLHRFANRPYSVFGQEYVPATELTAFRQRGRASWYGRRFHGQPTSSGEPYDMYAMTAAHPTLPIPSYARVTNPANGRTIVVRINDRGPFHKDRIIDLSYVGAHRLGYVNAGSAAVEVEAILPDEIALRTPSQPTQGLTARRGVFLQLGTFSSAAKAEGLRARVRDEFETLADRLELHEDGSRYRVQLGPFASADEARDEAGRIAAALDIRPFVVTR